MRKNILVLFLVFFVISVQAFEAGDGSESDPYEIGTCEQLQNMEEPGSSYTLVSNIDCEGQEIDPLFDQEFTGEFHGESPEKLPGYEITNLEISAGDQTGLFSVSSGEITNLVVRNSNIEGSNQVGAIVGSLIGGEISNVRVEETSVIASGGDGGGIIGNQDGGTVSFAYSDAEISGSTDHFGGIVGFYEDGFIQNAKSEAQIVDDDISFVGGFVGRTSGTDVSNSFSAPELENMDEQHGFGSAIDGTGGSFNDMSDSYFDNTTSNLDDDETGIDDHAVGLETSHVTGENAESQMTEFNFGEQWASANEYPIIAQHYFAGGSGTETDPYQIETCSQLQNIDKALHQNYEITTNIDCSGENFNPIGDNETAFTGTIDGSHNIIWDLEISGDEGENVGLISRNEGLLENIRIKGAEISGENMYGGILVAENVGGTIERSMTSGKIEVPSATSIDGFGTAVGGLVGVTRNAGYISESYSTAYVDSQRQGGLVGALTDDNTEIEKTYAAGTVTTDGFPSGGGGTIGDLIDGSAVESYGASELIDPDPESSDGGFAGVERFGGSTTDVYYDQNVSGMDGEDGDSDIGGDANPGVNLTTSMMINPDDQDMAGFDFEDTWDRTTFYYPKLSWQETGQGTESDPYMIEDCNQLQAMENNLDAHYQLANDIDCSVTEEWNDGQGFYPVGGDENKFSGALDGNGYHIKNLYIDRPDSDNIGLFGETEGADLTNLILQDVNVLGRANVGGFAGNVSMDSALENLNLTGSVRANGDNVGGLVGQNAADIFNSSSAGNVGSPGFNSNVGGLIGQNEGGVISKSFSTASVEADGWRIGGLVGHNEFGSVSNSYAMGDVLGTGKFLGGLVGRDTAGISESFSSGQVVGGNNAGGLVGFTSGGAPDSYWDVPESGMDSSDGGIGLHTYEMTDRRAIEYMDGFDFDSTWAALDGDRYPELQVFTDEEGFDTDVDQPPGLPSNEIPGNETEEVVPDTEFGVELRHPQDENMDVEFINDSDSAVIGQDSGSDLEGVNTTWSGLELGTTYNWYAVIEDETPFVLDTSEWIGSWVFTTIHIPEEPVNPSPENDTFNVPDDSVLTVDVFQEDGKDLVNELRITDDLQASKTEFGQNGTVIVNDGDGVAEFDPSDIPELGFENGVEYRWFVNSSFTADGQTFYKESDVWNFTTSEDPEPEDILPKDGETGVDSEPSLKVSIDHYSDVDVEFFDASDDSSLGEAQVEDGWANLTDYNEFTTVGQEFWYIEAEADTGETWTNSEDPWNFTVSDIEDLDIELQTQDEINRDNGSADLGDEELKAFAGFEGDQDIPLKFEIFDDSGNSVENITSSPVSSGENASVELSDAGLEQNKRYEWTAFYEESGGIPFGKPDQRIFYTFVLTADWERQEDDEGEEIEFFVSNNLDPDFPEDYVFSGRIEAGSGLSGTTDIAASNIQLGDAFVAARVVNPFSESTPIEQSEEVEIQ